MSASKGRYLAWYLGTSLVGVSEHNSRAISCPCVLGRDTAAVQADGRAWRPREDLTEGPLRGSRLWLRRVLLHSLFSALPLSHNAGSLLMNSLGLERLYNSLLSIQSDAVNLW